MNKFSFVCSLALMLVCISGESNFIYNTEEGLEHALHHDASACKKANPILLLNKDFAIRLVEIEGLALYDLNAFQGDEDVVYAAVEQNGLALAAAKHPATEDRDIVMTAIRNQSDAFIYASDYFKGDKYALSAALWNDGLMLQHASPELKGDKDLARSAINQTAKAFEHVSDELKGDPEIALLAIKKNIMMLIHADPSLGKNRDTVLKIVKRNHLSQPFYHSSAYVCDFEKYNTALLNIIRVLLKEYSSSNTCHKCFEILTFLTPDQMNTLTLSQEWINFKQMASLALSQEWISFFTSIQWHMCLELRLFPTRIIQLPSCPSLRNINFREYNAKMTSKITSKIISRIIFNIIEYLLPEECSDFPTDWQSIDATAKRNSLAKLLPKKLFTPQLLFTPQFPNNAQENLGTTPIFSVMQSFFMPNICKSQAHTMY